MTLTKFLNNNENSSLGNERLYDFSLIGLTTNRDNLYEIINNRVDKMINNGLLEEIKSLKPYYLSSRVLNTGIGYKELYDYFDNKVTLEEAIDNIKRNSRKYAKRQYTFFNHQIPVVWFNTDYNNFNNTITEVCSYINELIK